MIHAVEAYPAASPTCWAIASTLYEILGLGQHRQNQSRRADPVAQAQPCEGVALAHGAKEQDVVALPRQIGGIVRDSRIDEVDIGLVSDIAAAFLSGERLSRPTRRT